jgi:hypothetical protein
MTKQIKVLDALPGCGKTTAILKYMGQNRCTPWIYFSPMLDEVTTRVPNEALEHDMDLFQPYSDELYTKSETCLKALQEGRDICSTHSLLGKFTQEHIHWIKKNNYSIVVDEELSLIEGYPISKGDVDFLIDNKLISVDEDNGKVTWLDTKMDVKARYGDIKIKSDIGTLFAAKRSAHFMVNYLPPSIVESSNEFIILTYQYKGSVMQKFLELHGYDYDYIDLPLFKTAKEIKQELLERIEFIDTPASVKLRNKFALSKSWWVSATKEKRSEVSSVIRSIYRKSKLEREFLYYTVPKDYCCTSKGFETRYIGKEPLQDDLGNEIEHTRTYIQSAARSTNNYANKQLAVHAYNLFPNLSVKVYLQDSGFVCDDDIYALNMLLQWLFRGCIRKKDSNDVLKVCILSSRMQTLFKLWLSKEQL